MTLEVDSRREARTAANRARLRVLILKPTRTTAEIDEADDLAVKLGIDLKAALDAVAEAQTLRVEAAKVGALIETVNKASADYFATVGVGDPETVRLEAELADAKQQYLTKSYGLSWEMREANERLEAARQAAGKLKELIEQWPDLLA
jgi:hypothetical protein